MSDASSAMRIIAGETVVERWEGARLPPVARVPLTEADRVTLTGEERDQEIVRDRDVRRLRFSEIGYRHGLTEDEAEQLYVAAKNREWERVRAKWRRLDAEKRRARKAKKAKKEAQRRLPGPSDECPYKVPTVRCRRGRLSTEVFAEHQIWTPDREFREIERERKPHDRPS
jgi:hypothetical protein